MTDDSDYVEGVNNRKKKRRNLNALEIEIINYVNRSTKVGHMSDITNFIKSFSEQQVNKEKRCGKGGEGTVYMGEGQHKGMVYKILSDKLNLKKLENTNKTLTTVKGKRPISLLKMSTENIYSQEVFLNDFLEEVRILQHVKHPNIVCFYGICIEPMVIIMEYCKNGSLHSYLQIIKHLDPNFKSFKEKYSYKKVLKFLVQIARAMGYLHIEKNVIHGDLKPSNLLLDKDYDIKVTDFGFARIFNKASNSAVAQEACGSSRHGVNNPMWLAPEVICGNAYTKKSDVFSFGIIMWQLITFQEPYFEIYDGRDKIEFYIRVAQFVKDGNRLPVPKMSDLKAGPTVIYDRYVNLMKRCWDQIPDNRPTFKGIICEIDKMYHLLCSRQSNRPRTMTKNESVKIKNQDETQKDNLSDLHLNHEHWDQMCEKYPSTIEEKSTKSPFSTTKVPLLHDTSNRIKSPIGIDATTSNVILETSPHHYQHHQKNQYEFKNDINKSTEKQQQEEILHFNEAEISGINYFIIKFK